MGFWRSTTVVPVKALKQEEKKCPKSVNTQGKTQRGLQKATKQEVKKKDDNIVV